MPFSVTISSIHLQGVMIRYNFAMRICLVHSGLQERYQSLVSDPDIPAFHYGSHYSSAGAYGSPYTLAPDWLRSS